LRGFYGMATLRAVALSDRRQGVAVEYGNCWDGYCGTWLALFEADGAGMRHAPALELALSGVNIDGAADCARRLQPLVAPRRRGTPVRMADNAPASHDCYAIGSTWTVTPSRDAPGDLTLHYQGARSRADAAEAIPDAVDQQQVFSYKGGRYRAIAGFSPVPAI
jgi:hypothetical protein